MRLRSPRAGGNWNNAANDGPWNVNWNNAPAYANWNYGARLLSISAAHKCSQPQN